MTLLSAIPHSWDFISVFLLFTYMSISNFIWNVYSLLFRQNSPGRLTSLMLLTTLVFYIETNNPSGRRTFSSSSYEMSIPEQHKKKKNNQGKKDRKAYQADEIEN